MTAIASLPMHNLPEMRAVNAGLWQALREILSDAGRAEVPEKLSFERTPVVESIGPEVLFSQTCGVPLETIFRGQAVRLGTPARHRVDATAADCVTFAFQSRYRSTIAARVRILGRTRPIPAIPFVTSAETPAATVTMLRMASRRLPEDGQYGAVRGGLALADIVDVPGAA